MVKEEPNRSLLWPLVLVGIGVAGSLDEVVLHQLLPDDLVYVAVAAVMLLAGLLLLRATGSPRSAPGKTVRNQKSG